MDARPRIHVPRGRRRAAPKLLAVIGAVALLSGGLASPPTAAAQPAETPVSVSASSVPAVKSWTDTDGTTTLTAKSRIVVDRASRDVSRVAFGDSPWVSSKTAMETAQLFARDLGEVTGLDLPAGSGIARAGDISFELKDDPGSGADGYRLSIADGIVTVSANTTNGLYYGGRTVLQSLRSQADHRTLGNGFGADEPDMAMRVYTMDVSREYWEPRVVEDVIRQMGWQKRTCSSSTSTMPSTSGSTARGIRGWQIRPSATARRPSSDSSRSARRTM